MLMPYVGVASASNDMARLLWYIEPCQEISKTGTCKSFRFRDKETNIALILYDAASIIRPCRVCINSLEQWAHSA